MMSVGGMFNAMSISNTLSGMLMMNNGLNPPMANLNVDDDNCSLISGNTLQTFQNMPNPMLNLGNRLNFK